MAPAAPRRLDPRIGTQPSLLDTRAIRSPSRDGLIRMRGRNLPWLYPKHKSRWCQKTPIALRLVRGSGWMKSPPYQRRRIVENQARTRSGPATPATQGSIERITRDRIHIPRSSSIAFAPWHVGAADRGSATGFALTLNAIFYRAFVGDATCALRAMRIPPWRLERAGRVPRPDFAVDTIPSGGTIRGPENRPRPNRWADVSMYVGVNVFIATISRMRRRELG